MLQGKFLNHLFVFPARLRVLNNETTDFFSFQAVVAKVYKALFTQQRSLGIKLKDLKTHVNLTPMDPEELQTACTHDIKTALKAAGWYELTHGAHEDEDHPFACFLLGADPMATADGQPHMVPSLELDVQVAGPDTVHLLLKSSTVRFRHPAIAAFSPGADLRAASKEAWGTLCRVMPTCTPAIIDSLREASTQEVAAIERDWAGVGYKLPPGSSAQIVNVRFEEDEDAPVTPFPACAVLSFLGFDPVDTKLNSAGVLGALGRLRAELEEASFCLFGKGVLTVSEARRWDPQEKTSSAKPKAASGPSSGFQSAAQLADPGASKPVPWGPASAASLGEPIDLDSLKVGGDIGEGGSAVGRVKKPHARAGPELLAYLAKLEREEAEAAAAEAAAKPSVALPSSMLMAAQKAQDARASNAMASQKVRLPAKGPLLGAKRPPPAAQAGAKKAPGPAPKKKAVATAGEGGGQPAAPKPAKAAKPAVEIDVAALDVPSLASAGKLGSLTIPQLKAYCRSVKQPVGGKKGDLEARIKAHLGLTVALEQ